MTHRNGFCLIGIAAAALLTLTGCKTESTMSKEDAANFKGGPMPAGFSEKGAAPTSGPGSVASPAAPASPK